jgi:hypothetical protein
MIRNIIHGCGNICAVCPGGFGYPSAQPGFHMPATRAIISTRSNALDTLLTSPRCSFFEEVGNRFAAWIDTFAPEGHEDETGFHPRPASSTDSRAPLGSKTA